MAMMLGLAWKFPITTLLVNVALLVVVFVSVRSPTVVGENQVGYGYRVICFNDVLDSDTMIADLHLIRETDTYGLDIEHLQLTVRYDNQDRIRVHLTDSKDPRWEIPSSLIPRATTEQLNLLRNATPPTESSKAACRRLGFQKRKRKTTTQSTRNSTHPLEFSYTFDPFGFAITRKSNGEVLFNTTPSTSTIDGDEIPLFNNMVFKDQFIEISTQLPKNSSALFGLGEGTLSAGFRLAPGHTYTLWATDIASSHVDIDLYGSYPFYLDVRQGGVTHGVQLVNSNGMDITYGEDFLTFRVIGGILDFYFFAGSTPRAVVDQYTQFVGRPVSIPYWTLGFHQSRYGYRNLKEIETVVAKYKEVGLPLESMWSDIDYMDRYRDFTIDPDTYPPKKLRKFVDNLHANDQKYIMILDPGIKVDESYGPYVRGKELDVFVRTDKGEPYLAQVWPGTVHFPDFLHPNAQEFWSTEVANFHQLMPFDGLWLDMNEPSNFCSGPNCYMPFDGLCPEAIDFCCMICDNTNVSRWDRPPYQIDSLGYHRELFEHTIPMSALHHGGAKHYDVHNIYGFSQTVATYHALRETMKKRPFVMSRSLYSGSGAYSAHWTGDNGASWKDLKYSIASILNSGLFGVPMVGADICGFYPATWEELCNRWIQVGAFYPFARDHSDVHYGPQELYLWTSVTKSARKVLPMRYRLLPFLYTLLYEAHLTGAPVARALFYVFPEDEVTLDIDDQFLLGDAILISPVVASGRTTVRAYFPKGTWYNIFDWSRITSTGSFEVLDAPWDAINVHVRAGSIVPMQEYANTTTAVRKSPFTLLIALEGQNPDFDVLLAHDKTVAASGEVFLDDDDEIEMVVKPGTSTHVKFEAFWTPTRGTVRSIVTHGEWARKQGLFVHKIAVLGVQGAPTLVWVNGAPAPDTVQVALNTTTSLMEISCLRLPAGKDFAVVWVTTPSAEAGAVLS